MDFYYYNKIVFYIYGAYYEKVFYNFNLQNTALCRKAYRKRQQQTRAGGFKALSRHLKPRAASAVHHSRNRQQRQDNNYNPHPPHFHRFPQ